MIKAREWKASSTHETSLRIGTTGHLAILGWSLAMVMLVPAHRIHWAAVLCVGVAVVVYPLSLRRLLRPRWLMLMALMAVPPMLLVGEVDTTILGIGVSSEGVQAGIQIAVRFVVVLVAVDGFTSAVDVAAIAGLLERFGLQGLGFCIGVALNLLPALQESALHATHSLRMRGGLRHQRWRAIRLLLVTIVSNALRRAEEIALAAEARAFCPECARPMPIQVGRLDRLATALCALVLVGFCLF
jgi:energy-coupling factor transporter transmembrane protein EcfT